MLEYLLVFSRKKDGQYKKALDNTLIDSLCLHPNRKALIDIHDAAFVLSKSKDRLALFYANPSLTEHVEALNDSTIHFFEGQIINNNKIYNNIYDFDTSIEHGDHASISGNYGYGIFSEEESCMVNSTILGTNPVFWCADKDIFAVSSNPYMLAEVLYFNKEIQYSKKAVSWLLSNGYCGNLETLYKNIFYVPSNTGIIISSNNICSFYNLSADLYDNFDPEDQEAFFTKGYEQYVNTIAVLGKQQGAMSSNLDNNSTLTGGHDSRMALAAAIKAGVHKNFSFSVYGFEDHPDVIVAKQIAKKFDLPLIVEKPDQVHAFSTDDADSIISRACKKVFGVAGLVPLHTLRDVPDIAGKSDASSFRLGGSGGEFFKGYYSVHMLARSESNIPLVKDLFEPQNRDELSKFVKLVQKYMFHYNEMDLLQEEKLSSVCVGLAQHRGCKTIFDFDVFFTATRMAQFHGGLRAKRMNMSKNNPNYSTLFHKYAFAIPSHMRTAANVQFRVIEKSCPELLFIPLANNKWHHFNYYKKDNKAAFKSVQPVRNIENRPYPATQWALEQIFALKEILISPPPILWEVVDKNLYYKDLESIFIEKSASPNLVARYVNLAGILILLTGQVKEWFSDNTIIPKRLHSISPIKGKKSLINMPTFFSGLQSVDYMLAVQPVSLMYKD